MAVVAHAEESDYKADVTSFAKIARPFLQEHCVKCHGPEEQEAKLRLDTLENQFTDPEVAAKWAEVVTSVNTHQMPPGEEKQPELEASGRFVDWLLRSWVARKSPGAQPAWCCGVSIARNTTTPSAIW